MGAAGEDKLYGLPDEKRLQLNKMASEAISAAVYKEQVRCFPTWRQWPACPKLSAMYHSIGSVVSSYS